MGFFDRVGGGGEGVVVYVRWMESGRVRLRMGRETVAVNGYDDGSVSFRLSSSHPAAAQHVIVSKSEKTCPS